MWRIVLWAALAAFAALAVYAGFSVLGQDETAAEPPPERIQVRPTVFETTLDADASLEPSTTADLSFSIAGRVSEVLVGIGDSVAAGQAVARLDPVDLELELSAAEAEEGAARSTLRVSEAELAGLAGADDGRSQGVRDTVEHNRAQLAAAEARVELARRSLEKAELIAPFEGTVTAIAVQPGAPIRANEAAVSIADLTPLQVEVLLDQSSISRVKVDQTVHLDVDAFPGARLRGRVMTVAPTAQTDSGSIHYPVIVRLAPSRLPLRAGMTANVRIVTARHEAAITVPLRAVRSGPGRSMVEIIRRDALPEEALGIEPFGGFGYEGSWWSGFDYEGSPWTGFDYEGSPWAGFDYESSPWAGFDYEGSPWAGFDYQGSPWAGFGAFDGSWPTPGATPAAADDAAATPVDPDATAEARATARAEFRERAAAGATAWAEKVAEGGFGGMWSAGTPGVPSGSFGWGMDFRTPPPLDELGVELDGLPTRFVEVRLGQTRGDDVLVIDGLISGDIVVIPRDETAAAGR